MSTATRIIQALVARGVIPQDHAAAAIQELDRELLRRSRRIAHILARVSSRQVLLNHLGN